MIEKRYQVFVSSTFADLQEERREIMQALLELDCIPSGMELFPAANDDQWTLIKRVIADCDYYIVIIAGRYGSLHPSGVSYTEMEYRYALELGKPVIAFLHKSPDNIPAKKTEKDPAQEQKLEAFRALAQSKMVQFWDGPTDLGSKVSRSLIKLIKQYPATGWVRADNLPSEDMASELFELRITVQNLKAELAAVSSDAPQGTESLAQGNDKQSIHYFFTVQLDEFGFRKTTYSDSFEFTWNELFYGVSPLMIDEASDSQFKVALNTYIQSRVHQIHKSNPDFSGRIFDYTIKPDDFQTVKVQFRALGLISKSIRSRSVKDKSTYWSLTPYGDEIMTRLRAIRKNAGDELWS